MDKIKDKARVEPANEKKESKDEGKQGEREKRKGMMRKGNDQWAVHI